MAYVFLISQLLRTQSGEEKEGDWVQRGKQKIFGIHFIFYTTPKGITYLYNGSFSKILYTLSINGLKVYETELNLFRSKSEHMMG